MYLKDFFLYPFSVGGVKEDNMAGKIMLGKMKKKCGHVFLHSHYRGLEKARKKSQIFTLA